MRVRRVHAPHLRQPSRRTRGSRLPHWAQVTAATYRWMPYSLSTCYTRYTRSFQDPAKQECRRVERLGGVEQLLGHLRDRDPRPPTGLPLQLSTLSFCSLGSHRRVAWRRTARADRGGSRAPAGRESASRGWSGAGGASAAGVAGGAAGGHGRERAGRGSDALGVASSKSLVTSSPTAPLQTRSGHLGKGYITTSSSRYQVDGGVAEGRAGASAR